MDRSFSIPADSTAKGRWDPLGSGNNAYSELQTQFGDTLGPVARFTKQAAEGGDATSSDKLVGFWYTRHLKSEKFEREVLAEEQPEGVRLRACAVITLHLPRFIDRMEVHDHKDQPLNKCCYLIDTCGNERMMLGSSDDAGHFAFDEAGGWETTRSGRMDEVLKAHWKCEVAGVNACRTNELRLCIPISGSDGGDHVSEDIILHLRSYNVERTVDDHTHLMFA